jgi:uncharacterized cupredoxin-like copper-binding protein
MADRTHGLLIRTGAIVAGAAAVSGGLAVLPGLAVPPATSVEQTVVVVAGRPLEFGFALSSDNVRTGTVRFVVKNAGLVPHDFAIRGRITRVIPPGRRSTLVVRFVVPGSYDFISTLPGQVAAGMAGVLVVTGPHLGAAVRGHDGRHAVERREWWFNAQPRGRSRMRTTRSRQTHEVGQKRDRPGTNQEPACRRPTEIESSSPALKPSSKAAILDGPSR